MGYFTVFLVLLYINYIIIIYIVHFIRYAKPSETLIVTSNIFTSKPNFA